MIPSITWRRIALSLLALILSLTSAFCYHHLYGKKARHLLIIGCARSGTAYISEVLKRCGYKIGHEVIKKDGVCSWEMTVDTKRVPWGDARNGYHFRHIIHQVRHPLKVIASVYATEPPKSFKFIRKHIPEINEKDSQLTQSAKYWYYWNVRAEAQAEYTYRLEALDTAWDELASRLGKKLDRDILEKTPKTINARVASPHFTWEKLQKELEPDLYQKICALAQKYGYKDAPN